MTATRSAISAMTPISWVMSSIAVPTLSRSRRKSSRICAWMVTSSAVVGHALGGATQGGGAAQAEMLDQHLGDLEADGEERIEGGHRLLEDHRDVAAAQVAERLVGEPADLAPIEADGAALDLALRAEE